jgi:hypothetical protein
VIQTFFSLSSCFRIVVDEWQHYYWSDCDEFIYVSLVLENYEKCQDIVLSLLGIALWRERFGSFTLLTDTHPGTCPMSLSLPRLATNKVRFVFNTSSATGRTFLTQEFVPFRRSAARKKKSH